VANMAIGPLNLSSEQDRIFKGAAYSGIPALIKPSANTSQWAKPRRLLRSTPTLSGGPTLVAAGDEFHRLLDHGRDARNS